MQRLAMFPDSIDFVRQVSLRSVAALALLSLVTGWTPVSADTSAVMSSITGDWNLDGEQDIATLSVKSIGDDYMNLNIQLGSSSSGAKAKKTIVLPEFAWSGVAAGTDASLSISKRGSLVISTQNASIGRERWKQKVFIAYRNHQFVIAGFLYESLDTVTGTTLTCDVNLITGEGYQNTKHFRLDRVKLTVEKWAEDYIAKTCNPG